MENFEKLSYGGAMVLCAGFPAANDRKGAILHYLGRIFANFCLSGGAVTVSSFLSYTERNFLSTST